MMQKVNINIYSEFLHLKFIKFIQGYASTCQVFNFSRQTPAQLPLLPFPHPQKPLLFCKYPLPLIQTKLSTYLFSPIPSTKAPLLKSSKVPSTSIYLEQGEWVDQD